MADVFLVTSGEYEDYKILQAFTDRATAGHFADEYNRGREWNKAVVEPIPLRDAGWKPGTRVTLVTELALISGDVITNQAYRSVDWASEYEGDVRSTDQQRTRRWEVRTHGDARNAQAAHDDAVALVQAQIRGR